MKYLFVCAIGPVQDFIATARRSRDLWYGSWMLSELSKAAAKKVDVLFPKSLVFPDPALLETGSRLNVPNKISAIFEEDPGQRGEEVREAVAFRMEELGEDALKPVKDRIDYPLAQQQIKDLLEFYWVSVPFQSDKDYPEARDRAEALLAARKATRDFKQAKGMCPNPRWMGHANRLFQNLNTRREMSLSLRRKRKSKTFTGITMPVRVSNSQAWIC